MARLPSATALLVGLGFLGACPGRDDGPRPGPGAARPRPAAPGAGTPGAGTPVDEFLPPPGDPQVLDPLPATTPGSDARLDPFEVSPAVRAFGARARNRGAAGGDVLAAFLRQSARAGFNQILTPGIHGIRPPRTAKQLVSLLAVRRAGNLRSLESAILVTAAGRAAGLAMVVGEARQLAGRSVPDPAGDSGYFVVGTYVRSIGAGPARWTDLAGGEVLEAVPLDDRTVRACFLLQSARGLLATDFDAGDRAIDLVLAARSLSAPPTATMYAMEASVFLGTRHPWHALRAALNARKLGDDAPRRLLLALASSAVGRDGDFRKLMTDLGQRDRLVPALVLAGENDLAAGHPDLAALRLGSLLPLAPSAPAVQMLAAGVAMARGDRLAAELALNAAAAADREDLRLLIAVYLGFRRIGNDPAARRVREEAIRTAFDPAAARRIIASLPGEWAVDFEP